jgi:hypothetical protein
VAGFCGYGNEPSGFKRVGVFSWPVEWPSGSQQLHVLFMKCNVLNGSHPHRLDYHHGQYVVNSRESVQWKSDCPVHDKWRHSHAASKTDKGLPRGCSWRWRKLYNKWLQNVYSLPNTYKGDQIKEDEMGGTCSTYGEMRNAYKILIGKTEG